MFTAEEIEENFSKFRTWCTQLNARSENVLEMVDFLGTKLALCPASSKKDYHSSYPGGLVRHSLNVLENAVRIRRTFKWNISDESLVISALFHDIGKIGIVTDEAEKTLVDFYIDAEEWKQKRYGDLYEVNKDVNRASLFMGTPQRSVFVMQQFGIKLSREEYLAILLNDGWVVDANKDYCLRVTPLVVCVQTADYISTCQESKTDGF